VDSAECVADAEMSVDLVGFEIRRDRPTR
jgi:hypothetical protein